MGQRVAPMLSSTQSTFRHHQNTFTSGNGSELCLAGNVLGFMCPFRAKNISCVQKASASVMTPHVRSLLVVCWQSDGKTGCRAYNGAKVQFGGNEHPNSSAEWQRPGLIPTQTHRHVQLAYSPRTAFDPSPPSLVRTGGTKVINSRTV